MEGFEVEEWNQQSEEQLLSLLRDLLNASRSNGKSFKLDLMIWADDHEGLRIRICKMLKQRRPNQNQLSLREMEVFSLISMGYTNKRIAEKLAISYETVKSHRKKILSKTGSANTAVLMHSFHPTPV